MNAPSDRDDEPNERERIWLGAARRGFTPTAADAARVRAAVTLALGPTPPSPSQAPLPATPPPSPLFSHWLAKLAVAGALSGVMAASGYRLGFQAGRDSVTSATEATKRVAMPAPAASPIASSRDSPGVSDRMPASDPPPSAQKTKARESTLEPRASASSARQPSTLDEETRLLARIERALRDHNPRLALGLIGEIDRHVPGGQLTEERTAARAIAHCQLGNDAAPELAREFARRYPKSAYRTRVAETCADVAAGEIAPR